MSAREWGPNFPSCTAIPNMRLTTSPSGIAVFFPGCTAGQERAERRVLVGDGGKEVSLDIYWQSLVKKMRGAAHTASTHSKHTRELTPLTFLPRDSCVPSGLTTGYECICVHVLCARVT